MTDKELILKDLCARLPYGVVLQCVDPNFEGYVDWKLIKIDIEENIVVTTNDVWTNEYLIEIVKPYIRPMSSMTDEERRELNKQGYTRIAGESWHYCALNLINAFYNPEGYKYVKIEYVIPLLDWLNTHHFDYRGLIKRGLALEAPENMY